MAGQFNSPFGNANPFGSSRAQMHSLAEEDENASPDQAPSFGADGEPGPDAPPTLRSPPNPDSYPPQYNFNRRTSVSAESLKPSADTADNWSPPVYDKNPDQIARLKKAIEGNFLFNHLDDEQTAQILGALVEKPVPAKDIKVRGRIPWILHVMD